MGKGNKSIVVYYSAQNHTRNVATKIRELNGVTPEPYTGVYPVGSTKIGNKELYIVEGASHVDLYDNLDKIPFDKIESFLKESLEV